MQSTQTITALSFELASCQATIFTPDGDLSVSRGMKDFYPAFASLFDGEPTVLPPMPEGAPPEIPRIILESGSHEWRCELSPARANVFWRRTKSTVTRVELGDFFQKAGTILLQYTDVMGARVGRVAALTTRFCEHETPGLFLARHFCKEKWDKAPLNRPENFELHAHKTFLLTSGVMVNSWARSKTGMLKSDASQQPIVLFEQDINTLAEGAPTKDFRKADTTSFFHAAGNALDTILGLYFPDIEGG